MIGWLVAGLAAVGGTIALVSSGSSSSSSSTPPIVRVPAGAPPRPPNVPAELWIDWNTVQERSEATRAATTEQSRAAFKRELEKYSGFFGFYAPVVYLTGLAFFEGMNAIGKLLYGDPGWNSDENKARAKRAFDNYVLAWGFVPPTFNPDADAGALGYAEALEARLAALNALAWDTRNQWLRILTWVRSNPNHPIVADLQFKKWFPFGYGDPITHKEKAFALSILAAAARGVPLERVAPKVLGAFDAAQVPGEGFSTGKLVPKKEFRLGFDGPARGLAHLLDVAFRA